MPLAVRHGRDGAGPPSYAEHCGETPAPESAYGGSLHRGDGTLQDRKDGVSISLFDLAVLLRSLDSWQECRDALGNHFVGKRFKKSPCKGVYCIFPQLRRPSSRSSRVTAVHTDRRERHPAMRTHPRWNRN